MRLVFFFFSLSVVLQCSSWNILPTPPWSGNLLPSHRVDNNIWRLVRMLLCTLMTNIRWINFWRNFLRFSNFGQTSGQLCDQLFLFVQLSLPPFHLAFQFFDVSALITRHLRMSQRTHIILQQDAILLVVWDEPFRLELIDAIKAIVAPTLAHFELRFVHPENHLRRSSLIDQFNSIFVSLRLLLHLLSLTLCRRDHLLVFRRIWLI